MSTESQQHQAQKCEFADPATCRFFDRQRELCECCGECLYKVPLKPEPGMRKTDGIGTISGPGYEQI